MTIVKLFVTLVFIFENCSAVTNKLDKTTEFLFNLTNYAIESRRIRNPCIYEKDDISYFTCVKKLTKPSQNYSPNYGYGTNNYYHSGFYLRKPVRVPYQQSQNPSSVMEVLHTISRNDALRCVPRLLCEVTSDTISKSRQDFTLPTLPFNIDMGSIIRLLATIDFPGASPVALFGKAALLGYVSKGNSESCLNAYPKCPRDPTKLVQYLNNYNGGFFRYFNGVQANPSHNYHSMINYPQHFYPKPYYQNIAQKRIQNKPLYHDNANDLVIFLDSNVGGNFDTYNRIPKTLAFPTNDDKRFNEFTFKKPKELPFSISEYYTNELDLQRPLPNHKATPIIFPLRTGTGDLRLDAEELEANYKQKYYNSFVSFQPTQTNEDFYYKAIEELPTDFNQNKAVFSFPV